MNPTAAMSLTPKQVLYMLSLSVNEGASPNPGLAPHFGAAQLIIQPCPDGEHHAHAAVSLHSSFDELTPQAVVCLDYDMITFECTVLEEETVRQTLHQTGSLLQPPSEPDIKEANVGMYL